MPLALALLALLPQALLPQTPLQQAAPTPTQTLTQTPPQTPPRTRGPETDVTVPPHARPVLQAKAEGVQIYTCKPQPLPVVPPSPTDPALTPAPAFLWTFKAPEATLTDAASGQPLATHAAGPTWTAPDGSSIKGKVLAQRVAPDPLSIPWLLLAATPTATPGRLAHIAFVRRSDTHAGIAPADGCDATHAGTEARIPYTATYTFYTAE